MVHKALHALAVSVTAVAALTAPIPSARAVIFVSSFDPPFLSGMARFDVSANCLVTDGVKINDGITCTVNWLDLVETIESGTDTRTFSYMGFLPSLTAVMDIRVTSGALSGVDSSIIGPVLLAGNPSPDLNGNFSSDFTFTGTPGAYGLGVVHLFRNGELVDIADVLRFAPEPGVLALVGAALGAGWLALGRHRWRL